MGSFFFPWWDLRRRGRDAVWRGEGRGGAGVERGYVSRERGGESRTWCMEDRFFMASCEVACGVGAGGLFVFGAIRIESRLEMLTVVDCYCRLISIFSITPHASENSSVFNSAQSAVPPRCRHPHFQPTPRLRHNQHQHPPASL